mgnify:CR=1 FL=1
MRSSRIIAGCVVATSAILSCFNTVEAQSFRHGGAEFNAVRSVVASNEKGYSVVVTEFLAHGELRPDGRNLWVAARNREAVPFRVLQIGPGDFCRAAFQTVEGQSIYDVFYGGEPLQGDPPAWTSRDGLLLETRKFRQCNLRSLDSVRAAFEAAEPIGADFVDGVFHADNPFGQIGQPFLSRYSGYLHVKEPGVFGFYVSSRDCGFLLIDGKEAAAAPGRHGPQRQARPGLRRDVRLAAGEHKFEYYHAAAGAGAVMSAAWEVNPPGEKPGRPQKIPADAFNAPFIGRLPAGRVNMRVGGQSPDFLAETTGDVPLPDNNIPLIGVKFSNVSPQTLTAPGARMQWDFGDGQTSDFPNVDHVYLRPGLYTATLSIRRGARKAEITNRIYVDRPRTAPRDKPHVLDEYLRIIETYDPARLDAEALLQLALAFEAKALAQPDEADAYLSKAVRAVRAALQDGSAAEGEPAEQGGRGEQQDAAHEDAAPAQDVAGPAAEEQQTAEGQGVGADHPGEVGGAEFESVLDVRERDVHNRRVEYHHELAGRDDGERDAGMPAPACRTRLLVMDQRRGCHYGSPTRASVNARVHCCVNGRSPRQ